MEQRRHHPEEGAFRRLHLDVAFLRLLQEEESRKHLHHEGRHHPRRGALRLQRRLPVDHPSEDRLLRVGHHATRVVVPATSSAVKSTSP